ncbi:hypothetical protein B566_EDAN004235, partial [Ephemera danica]
MLHHLQQPAQSDPRASSRLLDAASPSGATHVSTHPLPASSTDSGVGSLRSSSSSDERSASASSSSRSSETGSATGNPPPPPVQPAAAAAAPPAAASSLGAPSEPVRVWRDPSVVQASEPLVRHIHSVQHLSLMPQHLQSGGANPPGERSAPAGPPSVAAAAAAAAHRGQSPYPPPPPPMLSPHMHSHLLPPPLYVAASQIPEMLWKQRYHLTPNAAGQPGSAAAAVAAQHAAAEEMRERVFAQDRDRQERFL